MSEGPHPQTFYDKNTYDPVHFVEKKGAKHEFGVEVEPIIPSESEIRFLGNKMRNCDYHKIGKDCPFNPLRCGGLLPETT